MTASHLILWTDDLSVRTQAVDEQHQELIGLLNQLHAAITGEQGVDTSREIFDQLTESMYRHFLFEESLMRLTHYAGYTEHKEQHGNLMDQMRALQTELDNNSTCITIEHLHFHKDWWIAHIRSSDQYFSTHYEHSALAYASGNAVPVMQKKPVWWKFW